MLQERREDTRMRQDALLPSRTGDAPHSERLVPEGLRGDPSATHAGPTFRARLDTGRP